MLLKNGINCKFDEKYSLPFGLHTCFETEHLLKI